MENPGIWSLGVLESRRKKHLNVCTNPVKGMPKVLPYSLPSVGIAADPGLQAVSPQVTF